MWLEDVLITKLYSKLNFGVSDFLYDIFTFSNGEINLLPSSNYVALILWVSTYIYGSVTFVFISSAALNNICVHD